MTDERKIIKYKAIIYSFRPLGVNLLAPPEQPILKNPINCLVGFLSYIAWGGSMTAYIVQNYTAIAQSAIPIFILIQSILSCIKLVGFFFYGKQHKQLINEIDQLAAQGNEQEREIWHAANRSGIFFSNLNYSSVAVTAVVYFGNPIVQMIYNYFRTDQFKYILPFEGLLPYDVQKLHNYIFSYTFSFIGAHFIIYPTTGLDGLFLLYVQNISAHCRILILKFGVAASQMHERRYAAFQQHLAAMVRYHKHVIALTNQFNHLFMPVFLANVTFDCFLICFLMYMLTTMLDLSSLLFSIMATSAIFSQLFIYCFGGGIIQAESESISDNLYLIFPWERMSPKMKRLMILPLMRAQRVSKLTGVFFVLDRNLLIWILRTAFSFTALLFAVMNKEGMLF